jgi:hypothetical protein
MGHPLMPFSSAGGQTLGMDLENVVRKISPLISGIGKDQALGVAGHAANLVAQNSRHPGISRAASLLVSGISNIEKARRDREAKETRQHGPGPDIGQVVESV